jgi:hypothetical protein
MAKTIEYGAIHSFSARSYPPTAIVDTDNFPSLGTYKKINRQQTSKL